MFVSDVSDFKRVVKVKPDIFITKEEALQFLGYWKLLGGGGILRSTIIKKNFADTRLKFHLVCLLVQEALIFDISFKLNRN